MAFEWIRFGLSALVVSVGLFVLGVATFGIYRFTYVLNRVHVAAKCDTLGALLVLSGLILRCSNWPVILHLTVIIVFMWLTNPVSSHLIVRLEVLSQDAPAQEYEELSDDIV
jgi:multicomponent Na+:H+ antiporter subunit G